MFPMSCAGSAAFLGIFFTPYEIFFFCSSHLSALDFRKSLRFITAFSERSSLPEMTL